MSEYGKHSVSKTYRCSSGYVGYDRRWTTYWKSQEEIRIQLCFLMKLKRLIPMYLIFYLQVLDDGRLTDNQGRLVDFKNTIIIMTSNIGSIYLSDGVDEKET